MHRRQYHFRELLWLQADTRAGLHQAITHLLDHLNQSHVRLSSVKVIIDIDPQDMP
jgi:primosomal protein N'